MNNFFTNKVIFITGGTGSWGQELTNQLLSYSPKEIIIYSRGEHKQVEMKRKFHNHSNIRYIVGDIRDLDRLKSVTKGADILFHLAALKHVPVCEENPYESVQTNIIGIQNVITASIENNIKKVIDVSTDKAVDPFNIYGTCKAVGEKMIIAANRETKETDFVCIRGGNVLGTNGSVVPLFIEQLKKTNKVTLTDPTMTRFLMISTFGNNNSEKIVIGSRAGEKKHELLVSQYESANCYVLDNNYFVILPMIDTFRDYSKYSKLEKFKHTFFGSDNTNLLTPDEFIEMLKLDGWFSDIVKKDSLDELEKMSKDEILNYFKNQGWL